MFTAKNKKAWNSTCYPFHCLRLSHCPVCRNEQRRTHADMKIVQAYYYTSYQQGIHRCFELTDINTCENFRQSKQSVR
ncbi:MAG: hypothetical protein J6W37_05330 [Bacteroidales bacterium]|nr:hypothetical protein [Bacteroidales bacterium]